MKVWINQKKCTGCGACVNVTDEVFVMVGGLAHVREGGRIFDGSPGNPAGEKGLAEVPKELEDSVIEAADDSPCQCIHIVE